MFNPALQISTAAARSKRGLGRRFLLFGNARGRVFSILGSNPPLWMERCRNSIHVAIRFSIRCIFLWAAGLASDQRKNVQNRGQTADVSRNTH